MVGQDEEDSLYLKNQEYVDETLSFYSSGIKLSFYRSYCSSVVLWFDSQPSMYLGGLFRVFFTEALTAK